MSFDSRLFTRTFALRRSSLLQARFSACFWRTSSRLDAEYVSDQGGICFFHRQKKQEEIDRGPNELAFANPQSLSDRAYPSLDNWRLSLDCVGYSPRHNFNAGR